MELTLSLFIGVVLIIAISLSVYCCLKYCANKKPEQRSVLYKRSTSLQYPSTQSQNAPVTQILRYSLSETRPTTPYPQTPPYPTNITPYPPQPPPIGFGLMPAYEASTSFVYPTMHTQNASISAINTNVQPPYPVFNPVPYPSPLPPTYDEAVRQSVCIRE